MAGFGSYNVNGTARDVFDGPLVYYVGVDHRPGPGVDHVGLAHEYPVAGWDGEPFDAVVTTEMLEHDPHWKKTLAAGAQLLRPGGLFVLTCATGGRDVHGADESPTPGFYENRSVGDVVDTLWLHGVRGYAVVVRNGLDLLYVGLKR